MTDHVISWICWVSHTSKETEKEAKPSEKSQMRGYTIQRMMVSHATCMLIVSVCTSSEEI